VKSVSKRTSDVLEYMKNHPGEDLHVRIIAHNVGYPTTQVNTSLLTLRDNEVIERTGHGIYRFQEPPITRTADPAAPDMLLYNLWRLTEAVEKLTAVLEKAV
jgi:hypothetical protein